MFDLTTCGLCRAFLCVLLQGYAGAEQLGEALKGADVIIIPAGVPRKPGMTRDDLFKVCARRAHILHVLQPLMLFQAHGTQTLILLPEVSREPCVLGREHSPEFVWLQTNAGIVRDLITAIAEHAPGVRHVLVVCTDCAPKSECLAENNRSLLCGYA